MLTDLSTAIIESFLKGVNFNGVGTYERGYFSNLEFR